MYPLDLPKPAAVSAPPFRDADSARLWLKSQPQAQPLQMQTVLLSALAALDASDLPAPTRMGILEALRSMVVLAQNAAEPRYARKPLPLPAGEAGIFNTTRRLWRTQATAYLRLVPDLPRDQAACALHRGVVALRLEQYAHFLAAWEVPTELLQLLYKTLMAAADLGVHTVPLADPEFRNVAESHIAGHVAWAYLLQLVDPYRLSAAQLTVANRALSRWRELATFQLAPENDPRARAVPLAALLGDRFIQAGEPAWLDVRPVTRKMRKRVEALEEGESPESLKLGRELSATACIRLLRQLDDALRPGAIPEDGDRGAETLVFGMDRLYALFTGEWLDPLAAPKPKVVDKAMSYQRMAVFGFDNLVLASTGKGVDVPGENWQAAGGYVSRAPEDGGRVLAPCLVGMDGEVGKPPRLGVMSGLLTGLDGQLRARLQWYPAPVQAASTKLPAPGGKAASLPVFVVGGSGGLTVILPAGAVVRPESKLVLDGATTAPVIIGEVLERGSDFVRYAARPQ